MLEQVYFGKALKRIGDYAFCTDIALTNVILPESVKSVGYNCFSFCQNLTTISFGKNIEDIGGNALYEDHSLSVVICKAKTPPAMHNFNGYLQHYPTYYVPINSLEVYKSTSPWSLFDKVIGINFNTPDVNDDGEVNIADVNACIDAITNNDLSDIYDVNGDGEISIADINAIIAAILGE